MFLSNTLYPLLSTGSTQETPQLDCKIVEWDLRHYIYCGFSFILWMERSSSVSGRVLDSRVQASLVALHCVFEQGNINAA